MKAQQWFFSKSSSPTLTEAPDGFQFSFLVCASYPLTWFPLPPPCWSLMTVSPTQSPFSMSWAIVLGGRHTTILLTSIALLPPSGCTKHFISQKIFTPSFTLVVCRTTSWIDSHAYLICLCLSLHNSHPWLWPSWEKKKKKKNHNL